MSKKKSEATAHTAQSAHTTAHTAQPTAEPPPLRLEWIEAGTLNENPANWRRHPEAQQHTLRDVLRDPSIGWAGACLYNEATGRLLDGHLRKAIADPAERIPVLIGRWTPEAEAKILATLDPIAAMAQGDAAAFDSLAATIDADSLWVRNLLEDVARACQADAEEETAEPTAAPNLTAMACHPFEHYDYVVLLFKSSLDFSRACDLFGIHKVQLEHPGGLTKVGLGRCIDGAAALDKLTAAASAAALDKFTAPTATP